MPQLSKRDQVARVAFRLGITGLLEVLPKRGCLTVLSYHRIGNHELSNYDPAVYSATADEFDAQISYLRRRHRVISLEEAIDLLQHSNPRVKSGILLTFDDGYLDNYDIAFPILRAHGVPAVFFLCTTYVGTAIIPWWDHIAYLVRRTTKDVIHLDYPSTQEFDLTAGRASALVRILKVFKSPATKEPHRMIAAIENACEVPSPVGSERMFLNWDEATEMLRGGMSIGSHTHTHNLLAKASYDEQVRELRTSKQILQARLGAKIASLAYPVGGLTAFSRETMDAASVAGFEAAFSNYGGFNIPGQTEPFDIRRNSVDFGTDLCRLRLQCTVGSLTRKYWF
jgi:peptidoglycan/xylan/chitin deacetylase (PgdA/CDA1 family)